METEMYDCGHRGPIPPHMGRGQARKRRIAVYFGRRCPQCAREHIRQYAASLTHPDASPLTPDEQAAYVARRMSQLTY